MLAAASCARFHRGEGRRRHRAKGGQESQGEAGTLHASVFLPDFVFFCDCSRVGKVNMPMARPWRVDLMRLIIAALVLCANVPSAEGFFGNLVGRLTKSAGHKLFDAASDGNLEDVQALLGSGTGPDDYTDPGHGSSALIMASEGGFIEVVYNLLEAGADPNFARSDGATALMGAGALGHLEVVKLLLYRGSLPDAQDSNGTSALMFASHRGDFHVCNLLLQHGASVNLQNNDGSSALHWASFYGHTEVVRLLIDYHADPALADAGGATAVELTEEDPVGAWAASKEQREAAQQLINFYRYGAPAPSLHEGQQAEL